MERSPFHLEEIKDDFLCPPCLREPISLSRLCGLRSRLSAMLFGRGAMFSDPLLFSNGLLFSNCLLFCRGHIVFCRGRCRSRLGPSLLRLSAFRLWSACSKGRRRRYGDE